MRRSERIGILIVSNLGECHASHVPKNAIYKVYKFNRLFTKRRSDTWLMLST